MIEADEPWVWAYFILLAAGVVAWVIILLAAGVVVWVITWTGKWPKGN